MYLDKTSYYIMRSVCVSCTLIWEIFIFVFLSIRDSTNICNLLCMKYLIFHEVEHCILKAIHGWIGISKG